jgi:hypothetical protein
MRTRLSARNRALMKLPLYLARILRLGPKLCSLSCAKDSRPSIRSRFNPLLFRDLAAEAPVEILRTRKFTELTIPRWLRDTKDERLKLSQMLVADCQIHAKCVPSLRVSISQMPAQPAAKVRRET